MKKIVIIVLFIFSHQLFAHRFIEEMLISNSPEFFEQFPHPKNLNDVNLTLGRMMPYGEIFISGEEINGTLHVSKLRNFMLTKLFVKPESRIIAFPTHDGLDHFDKARYAAIERCIAQAADKPLVYPNGAVPVFTGPDSLIDPQTVQATDGHHDNYNINEGIRFFCRRLDEEQ